MFEIKINHAGISMSFKVIVMQILMMCFLSYSTLASLPSNSIESLLNINNPEQQAIEIYQYLSQAVIL